MGSEWISCRRRLHLCSEHSRIVQSIGGTSPSTTTYLNALGARSEKFVAGTATTWHDCIHAGGKSVRRAKRSPELRQILGTSGP